MTGDKDNDPVAGNLFREGRHQQGLANGFAQAALDASPYGHRVEIRMGPAVDTIRRMEANIDLAFIDADKTNYESYYEGCLKLLRPGGVITIDNVLWSGSVADPDKVDPDTEALRAISRHVHADERVDISMVPIGDGLTIAIKR